MRTGEDDGLDAVILTKLPDEQLREVTRVYKLTEGLAGAANNEGGVVLWTEMSA